MSSETSIATIAKGATAGGSSFALGSAVVHYDIGVLCGILIGVIGIIIQAVLAAQKWIETRRSAKLEKEHDRREAEFHAARMKALQSGIELAMREDLRKLPRGEQ